MRLFLYGSLLDPAVLAAQSGRRGLHRAARPALLRGWRRVALRGTPWPTLLRARRGAVHGLLLEVAGEPLRRLAAYEGWAYRLRALRVRSARGACVARAWIAPARKADAGRDWTFARIRE